MATVTQEPRQPKPTGTGTGNTGNGTLVAYDEFVEQRIAKVRGTIRSIDLWTSIMVLAAAVVAYLLVFVVLDHWIVPGGLGDTARTVLLGLFAAGVVGYVVWAVVPVIIGRINAFYAARTVERAEPRLKNSVVNFLDLKQHPEGLSPRLLEALERRAANDLQQVNVEATVSRDRLVKVSYVLMAVVVLACLYTLFNRNTVFDSLARAFLAPRAAPTDTRVRDIDLYVHGTDEPVGDAGEASIAAGTQLGVRVFLRGEQPEQVTLAYTTLDGQFVDTRLEMEPEDDAGMTWRYVFRGDGGRGLQASFDYRVLAGDTDVGPFRIEVVEPPTARLESITYRYPLYTGLHNETLRAEPQTPSPQPSPLGGRGQGEGAGEPVWLGEIDAVEGTQVEIVATTNVPAHRAGIDLDQDRNRQIDVQMDATDPQRIVGRFTLRRGPEGEPLYNHYQILFQTADGDHNPDPILYPIIVRPDPPPIVHLARPAADVSLPANGSLPLEVEAADEEFGLSRIVLHVERGTEALLDQPLAEGHVGAEFRGSHTLNLAQWDDLQVGDVLDYWVEAVDNREPEPNRERTPTYHVTITPPEDQQLAQADPNQQPQQQPDQPQGEQGQEQQQDRRQQQGQPGGEGEAGENADEQRPRAQQDGGGQEGQPQRDQDGQGQRSQQPGGAGDSPQNQPLDPTDPNALRELAQRFQDRQQNQDRTEQPHDQPQNQGEQSEQQDPQQSPGSDQQQERDQQGRGSDPQSGSSEQGHEPQPREGADSAQGNAENPPGREGEASADPEQQQGAGSEQGGEPPRDQGSRPGAQPPDAENPAGPQGEAPDEPEQQQGAGSEQSGDRQSRPEGAEQEDPSQPGAPHEQPGSRPEGAQDAGSQQSGAQPDATPQEEPDTQDQPGAPPQGGEPAEPQPGGEGQQPGQDSAMEPDAQPGAEPGEQPGEPGEPDAQPGAEPTEPGPQPGAEPGMQPGEPGMQRDERGSQPPDEGSNPGTQQPENGQAGEQAGSGREGQPPGMPQGAGNQPDGGRPDQGMRDETSGAEPGSPQAGDEAGEPEQGPERGSGRPDGREQPQGEESGQGGRPGSQDSQDEGMQERQGTGTEGTPDRADPDSTSQTDQRDPRASDTGGQREPDSPSTQTGEPGDPEGPQPRPDENTDQPGQDEHPAPPSDRQGDAAGEQRPGEQGQGQQPSDRPGQEGQGSDPDAPPSGQTGRPAQQPNEQQGGRPGPTGDPPSEGEPMGDGPLGTAHDGPRSGTGASATDSDVEDVPPGDERGSQPGGQQPHEPQDENQPEEPTGDPANLDYARRATDLVLDQLRGDLERGEVDEEMLRELGWTEDDLRRFLEHWEQARQAHDARDPSDPEASEAAREFEQVLENLAMEHAATAREAGATPQDDMGAITRNIEPPREIREPYEQFRRSISRYRLDRSEPETRNE